MVNVKNVCTIQIDFLHQGMSQTDSTLKLFLFSLNNGNGNMCIAQISWMFVFNNGKASYDNTSGRSFKYLLINFQTQNEINGSFTFWRRYFHIHTKDFLKWRGKHPKQKYYYVSKSSSTRNLYLQAFDSLPPQSF